MSAKFQAAPTNTCAKFSNCPAASANHHLDPFERISGYFSISDMQAARTAKSPATCMSVGSRPRKVHFSRRLHPLSSACPSSYFEVMVTEGFLRVQMSQPCMTLLLDFYILLWSRALRNQVRPVFLTKDRRIEIYAPLSHLACCQWSSFQTPAP